jgi:class 3 adenylate cyclase
MPDELDSPSAQSLERKLATILSADVAEFSRLMGEDEEDTLRTFRGHKQVFESLVAMHRGRVFNTAGDAILAEFGSAVEAVRCATDIQAALRTRNDNLPPNRQVRFRIGINLGDVMVQGVDLMGDGVNVAARLQTAAEPGGICISGSVHDQIRNKLSLSFLSLGERSYKNISQPIRTFSISEAEGAGTLPATKPEATPAKSSSAKWLVAAVVLALLLAGGGFWAYTVHQHSKAEQAQASAVAAQPPATPPPTASRTMAPLPNAATPTTAPPQPAATPPALAAGSPVKIKNSIAGTYSGPVCFAQTQKEPHRCFRAEGTINGRKITGQWFMGPEKKMIMVLTGDVSKSGDVVIEMVMHSETPDGARLASINVQGTLHDGIIDTIGTFRNGRPATLNWHKNPE